MLLFHLLLLSLSKPAARCRPGSACEAPNTICCIYPTDTYCIEGGKTCCHAGRGVFPLECPLDTECCVYQDPLTGSSASACCSANSTCDPTAGCVADDCTTRGRNHCYQNGVCGWCCHTNQCQGINSWCPGEKLIDPLGEESCPDPCTAHETCEDCKKEEAKEQGCGWCCSTGKCISGDVTAFSEGDAKWCGRFNFIGNYTNGDVVMQTDQPCGACMEGGQGLHPIELPDDGISPMWLGVALGLISCCVCSAWLVVLCLWRNSRRRESGFRGRTIVREGEQLPDPKSTSKYHFGEEYPDSSGEVPEHEAGGLPFEGSVSEDKLCVACCDHPIEVVFLPCNHTCCCRGCSLLVEETHINQQISKRFAEPTLPTCPLCREEITDMICYPSSAPAPITLDSTASVQQQSPSEIPHLTIDASSSSSPASASVSTLRTAAPPGPTEPY